MKTSTISENKTSHLPANRFNVVNLGKRLLAATLGAFVALGATVGANAQTAMTKPTGLYQKVADMTTKLLTTPLTVSQRQALHAQNFKQLAASERPYYLHTVAYAVAYAVASDGNPPTSAKLVLHLQSVTSIYVAPPIPAEVNGFFNTEMLLVNTALTEFNVNIAGQIARDTKLQQAMYVGATDGFFDVIEAGF